MQPGTRCRRMVGRTGVALVLALGLAACGSDGNTASSTGDKPTTPTAGGAADAACSALVEFNTAASGDTDSSTPEASKQLGTQLAPLWKQASAAAPATVKDDVAKVTAAMDGLVAGDGTAFNSDAAFESYGKVLGAAVDECGFDKQAISATETSGEYHFEGVPDSLKAGIVAFSLTNKGAEPHVLDVARKKDGETRSAQELLALPQEEGQAAVEEAGSTFAPPGASSVGLSDLAPGDYVYFCPIPIGDNGPPHFTKGMYGEFTVE